MPDRIVIPSSQRPPRSSDRLALEDRGPGPFASRRARASTPWWPGTRTPRRAGRLEPRDRRRPRHAGRPRVGAAQTRTRSQQNSDPIDRFQRRSAIRFSRQRSSLRPGQGSGRALRARARAGSGSTVADLRAALGEHLPALAPLLPTVMIAVDEEYAGDDAPIPPGSRLAVIPPVSGGAGTRGIRTRLRIGGLFHR